jgi:hypothetical protein
VPEDSKATHETFRSTGHARSLTAHDRVNAGAHSSSSLHYFLIPLSGPIWLDPPVARATTEAVPRNVPGRPRDTVNPPQLEWDEPLVFFSEDNGPTKPLVQFVWDARPNAPRRAR